MHSAYYRASEFNWWRFTRLTSKSSQSNTLYYDSTLYKILVLHVHIHVEAYEGQDLVEIILSYSRLDAGTFGAMGLGAGYAIAASIVEKMKLPKHRCPVFCIQGDSAFGFAGMEFETACRYAYLFTYHIQCCILISSLSRYM